MPGATNGWHHGSQIFACPDRKAVFVPFTHFNHDTRFANGGNGGNINNGSNGFAAPAVSDGAASMNGDLGDFGDLDCPQVPGFHPPIRSEDVLAFYGRNRGIQGHKNSCYLDATLFAMFSFTRLVLDFL